MNFFFLTKLFELFRIIIFGSFLIYFPVFFLPKFFLFFYLSRIFSIFLLVNIFLIFRLFFFFKLFSRMIIIIQRFFLVFWFFSIRILAVQILKPLKIFGILIFTSLFANNKLLKLFFTGLRIEFSPIINLIPSIPRLMQHNCITLHLFVQNKVELTSCWFVEYNPCLLIQFSLFIRHHTFFNYLLF